MRTLLELYDLIIEEKATYEDYQEFLARLALSSFGPVNTLKFLKEERKKEIK